MKLTINVNGKTSYIFVYDTEINFDYSHAQCIEFLNDGIRFNNYSQQITVTKNMFSIKTPYLCSVAVERHNDISAYSYDYRANLNAIYDLVFYEICDFIIDNAEVRIDNNVMMTVKVSESSLVILEIDNTVKEMRFEKRFSVENGVITKIQ